MGDGEEGLLSRPPSFLLLPLLAEEGWDGAMRNG